jgi:F-type H+-transporting ATPase subunit c
VNKFSKFALMAAVVVLCFAGSAMAQTPNANPASDRSFMYFTAAFGAAITTCGAAYGISKLASSAVESMARQPEVAGTIQVAMIIAAALIEGFTFFALVVCLQSVGK